MIIYSNLTIKNKQQSFLVSRRGPVLRESLKRLLPRGGMTPHPHPHCHRRTKTGSGRERGDPGAESWRKGGVPGAQKMKGRGGGTQEAKKRGEKEEESPEVERWRKTDGPGAETRIGRE